MIKLLDSLRPLVFSGAIRINGSIICEPDDGTTVEAVHQVQFELVVDRLDRLQ